MVRVTAHRGKWIDQSQSFNIFYGGHSGKDLNEVYMYAWELGLKTTYYLRTLAVSQVEKSTVSTEKFGDTHKRTTGAAAAHVAEAPGMQSASLVHTAAPAPVSTVVTAVATASPFVASVGAAPGVATEPKLCKIADPDCEACQ